MSDQTTQPNLLTPSVSPLSPAQSADLESGDTHTGTHIDSAATGYLAQTNGRDKSSGEPDGDEVEQSFTGEDLLLYLFTFVLIGSIGFYFWGTQKRQEESFLPRDESDRAWTIKNKENHQLAVLEAQLAQIRSRHQYATKVLLSSSTRKNTGFLVGTLLAFMGCIIIIRRVRKMPAHLEWEGLGEHKLKFLSSSPGLIITLLGSIIILATILHSDRINLQDEGLGTAAPHAAVPEQPDDSDPITPAKPNNPNKGGAQNANQ